MLEGNSGIMIVIRREQDDCAPADVTQTFVSFYYLWPRIQLELSNPISANVHKYASHPLLRLTVFVPQQKH